MISIKKNEHKWRKNEDGSQMSDKCPVCKEEIEDRQHYDYDCKQTQNFFDRITETFDEMKEKKKQQKRKKREYKSRPTPRVSAAVAEADKSGHYYYRDTYQGDYWKIANSPETIEREENEEEEREKEWERKEVDRQKAEEERELHRLQKEYEVFACPSSPRPNIQIQCLKTAGYARILTWCS